MTRKWIIACAISASCGLAGALAWHFADGVIGLPRLPHSEDSRGYVRIELPAVKVVEPREVTDADANIMLRDSIDRDNPLPIAEQVPPAALAANASTRGRPRTDTEAVASAPEGATTGMLAVNYDLSDETTDDRDTFEIRKGVRINGRDAGQATIRVGSGSTLSISLEDLQTLLTEAEQTDFAVGVLNGRQLFMGFDEVREKGLNVRYDAVSDRILISS